jgi:hypothetical protein
MVKITRYIFNKDPNSSKFLLEYFKSEKWIEKNSLFNRQYTSFYYKLSSDENFIYIDNWGEGPFGIILPLENRIIGIIDRIGDKILITEFEKYLSDNNIKYRKSFVEKKGKNQTQYLVAVIIYLFILCIVFRIIL